MIAGLFGVGLSHPLRRVGRMKPGVLDAIDEAERALDPARTTDLATLSDDELHEALRRLDLHRRKSEAGVVRLLGEIDVRRSFEPLGAKSAGAFAAWQLPIADDLARSLVRCSRQL